MDAIQNEELNLSESDIKTLASAIAVQISARWLKAKAAAAYSAIGVKRLKQLADEGKIAGFPDPDSGRGDWIFDRDSLDRYRENQAGNDKEKILAIMGKS